MCKCWVFCQSNKNKSEDYTAITLQMICMCYTQLQQLQWQQQRHLRRECDTHVCNMRCTLQLHTYTHTYVHCIGAFVAVATGAGHPLHAGAACVARLRSKLFYIAFQRLQLHILICYMFICSPWLTAISFCCICYVQHPVSAINLLISTKKISQYRNANYAKIKIL